MKNKIQALREWLAHHCLLMAIRCDFDTTMRRAHVLVCHAAARAAIDAGAEGDVRVRILVDNGVDDGDVWEAEPDIDLNGIVPTTVH